MIGVVICDAVASFVHHPTLQMYFRQTTIQIHFFLKGDDEMMGDEDNQ